MNATVKNSNTTKTRKSAKASQKASAADAMLKAAFDAAQVEYPPLSQLVKSPKTSVPCRIQRRVCANWLTPC